MELIKSNLIKILIALVLILISASMIKSIIFNRDKDEIESLRKEIVTKSELLKKKDGRYEKLVNDYNTEKSLSKKLDSSNNKLYEDLKKTEERLISVTSTLLSYKKKVDTVYLDKPIEEVIYNSDTLNFYYPKKEDFLINHSIVFDTSSKLVSKWNFNPTPLDLVITETKLGIYKANIDTNPWVEIKSLEVNTLPFSTDKNTFGWAYGAGMWKSPVTWGVDIHGGVRINKVYLLLRLQPSKDSQLGAVIIYNPR